MSDNRLPPLAPPPPNNKRKFTPAVDTPQWSPAGVAAGQFDIFEWHPALESCQRYFLDEAQYDSSVRALCALINITLPYQWPNNPVVSASPAAATPIRQSSGFQHSKLQPQGSSSTLAPARVESLNWVSLVPYIRRLIITGSDKDAVLQGFFGDDWRKGIGPIQECERRNYLFAAKSGGWAGVKREYDMGPQETVPYLTPPYNVQPIEIDNAEKLWSQWLAMEDWLVGPRAPDQTQS